MNSTHQPLFSIITAVYNVEPYLEQCIQSVINQTIELSSVQLILVDDGSTDSSGLICDRYADLYPNCIEVIHKINGGVSSARNAGLHIAKGELVNFLDSDDYLSPDCLKTVYRYYTKHKNESDVFTIPLLFFEGKNNEHYLNNKFRRGSRILDLREEWNYPLLHVNCSFIKRKVIGTIEFCEQLHYAEDARFIQEILLNKPSIGLISTTYYHYRFRNSGVQSALQKSQSDKNWYDDYLTYFSEYLLLSAKKSQKDVPRFLQYTVLHDLLWRIKVSSFPPNMFKEEEKEAIRNKIAVILSYIESELIVTIPNIQWSYRAYLLYEKHKVYPKIVAADSPLFKYPDGTGIPISNLPIRLEFISLVDDQLYLEGFIPHYPFFGAVPNAIEIQVDGVSYSPEMFERYEERLALEESVEKRIGFKFSCLVSSPSCEIKFIHTLGDFRAEKHHIVFGKFCPINTNYRHSYYFNGRKILTTSDGILKIRNCRSRFPNELLLDLELLSIHDKNSIKGIFTRLFYHVLSVFKSTEIWLISDRIIKSSDNGEAFFRYLCDKKPSGIKYFFVIHKDSADFNKLSKVGPVIKHYSIKHRMVHLLSDKIISSHADEYVLFPFAKHGRVYQDILSQKEFVFLQHGVTQNDVSNWLNRYNKNIHGLVTVSVREYESFLTPNYYYSSDRIWLTGFPRYDRLYNDEKSIVTLMPTWRQYLAGSFSDDTGNRAISSSFVTSDYFNFYNSLINDPRLLQALKEHHYTLHFLPHPTLVNFIDLFHKESGVEFLDITTEYRDVYARSKLVITDYSSAAFDFSYLRKPIIYCQFDKEEFFAGDHICKTGYFDYEKDGFGEVEYSLEDTVNRIIEYLDNDCVIKPVYSDRIDKFFNFNDHNNCERLYQRLTRESSRRR